jgi:hypothetical protein
MTKLKTTLALAIFLAAASLAQAAPTVHCYYDWVHHTYVCRH